MEENVKFYIVPTPIGNLNDITNRAISILNSVDIIACEDCRTTQNLLNHFDIKTKTVSYHKFNEKERVKLFLDIISEGKTVALVSDAGTPLICDPGSVLVEELRKNNVKISALPGANAVITFLSQIPRTGEDFAFVGFLPKTDSQIKNLLQNFSHTNTVFYDSPNRLLKTLDCIKSFNPNAKIAVGRELTKIFEEIIVDSVDNVINYFQSHVLKGEIVAMLYAKTPENFAQDEILNKIKILQDKKFSAKDISIILSSLYNLKKNEIYKLTSK
ncbi:16S rRNA (cytidine(1402)-2'-O)-methyltransferase [bacterium]|nr:16S rRNA (cytidine(1402)-2'-O)-methyltransferase [bacterium]